jgi:uncharacterized protein
MLSIESRLAKELVIPQSQITAAMKLLDEGSTVPFISRYRKEATGGLDDSQLRLLEKSLKYLRELDDRRASILGSIRRARLCWRTYICPISKSAALRVRLQ